MKMNSIPNTDLLVSNLCLGTMTFGTPVEKNDAIKITQHAINYGMNFIDTADIYEGYTRYIGSPGGIAEAFLGSALKSCREKVILASKVGMKVGKNDDDQGLSRKHVLKMIDMSLGRLQTDYLDIYYMHKPDDSIPLEESILVFNDLIDAGKIRYWGVSNFSAIQLTTVLRTCDENHWARPVTVQPAYSLLKRDIEQDLLPYSVKENLAVVPYQVLQGGLLTGKYMKGGVIPERSRLHEKPEWSMSLSDDMYDQLALIAEQANGHHRSMLEHALKSLLEQKGVVSLIVGVKSIQQLDNLIDSVK